MKKPTVNIDLRQLVLAIEDAGKDLNELNKGNCEDFSNVLLDVLEESFYLESLLMKEVKAEMERRESNG